MHTTDIKLFLANKKKERESKFENIRGKIIIPAACNKPPRETSDSTTLSQHFKSEPLLNNVTFPGDKNILAAPEGDKVNSANLKGEEILCGDLQLAE